MAYKILAIDDHPETLDIIVTTLRSNGYKVVGSQSPLKGLSLAEKMQPDLVLVDMNMPEIDGKEVCRRLRAHPQLSTVPIIMFTAEAEAYQKVEGFDAGADDYLTKPTEPEEMIARIEAMLASAANSRSLIMTAANLSQSRLARRCWMILTPCLRKRQNRPPRQRLCPCKTSSLPS